uniref:Uncharacterized protein n=1 Tax=Rhizophora mucronata TaxID=61149 RepID=A0A2P2L2Z2_RHIMU
MRFSTGFWHFQSPSPRTIVRFRSSHIRKLIHVDYCVL